MVQLAFFNEILDCKVGQLLASTGSAVMEEEVGQVFLAVVGSVILEKAEAGDEVGAAVDVLEVDARISVNIKLMEQSEGCVVAADEAASEGEAVDWELHPGLAEEERVTLKGALERAGHVAGGQANKGACGG